MEVGEQLPETNWYRAALADKENWVEWLEKRSVIDSSPLEVEPVFKAINDMATDDAIFQVDVGNVTIDGMRLLDTSKDQKFTTSGWYATMGYALPAAIGAKAQYPDRQVWSISGDGAWAMVMPDILTQVKYNLPIINVVLTNKSLGFIEAEQDDAKQPHSGIDLIGANFGASAAALGALGFDVNNLSELKEAFAKAKEANRPTVINVNIFDHRPLPVEQLQLDSSEFEKEYQTQGLIPFSKLIKE